MKPKPERYRSYNWRDDAACSGKGEELGYIWWGTRDQPQEEIDLALSYCARCPVTDQCKQDRLLIHQGYMFIQGGERL